MVLGNRLVVSLSDARIEKFLSAEELNAFPLSLP
jgi:hypothetical protein